MKNYKYAKNDNFLKVLQDFLQNYIKCIYSFYFLMQITIQQSNIQNSVRTFKRKLYYKISVCAHFNIFLLLLILYHMRSNNTNQSGINTVLGSARSLSPKYGSQLITQHLKSVHPELDPNQFQEKKFLNFYVHSSLKENSKFKTNIITRLQSEFGNTCSIETFEATKQLLTKKYNDHDLYFLLVHDKFIDWAQDFATQERQQNMNKKKIFVVGFLDGAYKKKSQKAQRHKSNKFGAYILYCPIKEELYYQPFFQLVDENIRKKIQGEANHLKTWNLSNKYRKKDDKLRTLHFYYDKALQPVLSKLYKKYSNKSRGKWLQIHLFQKFDQILENIRDRQRFKSRQKKHGTVMMSKMTSNIGIKTQKSLQSQRSLSPSVYESSNISANKLMLNRSNKIEKNIILINENNEQIPTCKNFVTSQQQKNWQLVVVSNGQKDLENFLEQQFEQAESLEREKIINSKTLYILAKSDDYKTKDLFQRQENVFKNMQLIQYANQEDFFTILRKGVQPDFFTIAVVPGSNNIIDSQYQQVIQDFENQYKNMDYVDNYRYIISFKGRYQNKIITSTLQVQSNINSIDFEEKNWLQNIMKSRDMQFHPFLGLKGVNVTILYKQNKPQLVDDLRTYIGQHRRLLLASYIDKKHLDSLIKTSIPRNSVIVITNDNTLRQAQQVVTKFNQVFILNITSRQNVNQEIKVFFMGDKEKVHKLVKKIPQLDRKLEEQVYEEANLKSDMRRQRKNRTLPATFDLKSGNTISVRLPSHVTDPQSRKFQVRLMKHFNEQINFGYYQKPEQILLTNKLQQLLSFIICTQKQLNQMKKIASAERQQLRQEFILYCQNPDDEKFNSLVEKDKYQRFRFISNKWSEIEQYIIGTYNLIAKNNQYAVQINSDQIIHVFMQKNMPHYQEIQRKVKQYAQDGSESAKRCIFYPLQYRREVLIDNSYNDTYYLIINQNDQNCISKASGKTILEECQKYQKKFGLLVINSDLSKHQKKTVSQIKNYETNNQNMAKWLSKIKVNEIMDNKQVPIIVCDDKCWDWRYFLIKKQKIDQTMVNRYGKNRHIFITGDKEETMQKLREKYPNDYIWILVKNNAHIQEYLPITNNLPNPDKIKFLLHGYQSDESEFMNNKIVFSDTKRKEVQAFIKNPFRLDKFVIFPSALRAKQIILAIEQVSPIQWIRMQEVHMWKKQLNAMIIPYSSSSQLQQIIEKNPGAYIYIVHDINTDIKYRKILNEHPNIKRIIFDRRLSQNNMGALFQKNPNKLYYGNTIKKINHYLINLRHNIKSPPQYLSTKYTKQLIYILISDGLKINRQAVYERLKLQNDSIMEIKTFDPDNIVQELNKIKPQYEIVVVGDLITSRDIKKYRQQTGRTIHYIQIRSPQKKEKQQQSVDEDDFNRFLLKRYEETIYRDQDNDLITPNIGEYLVYLFNLPENRYMTASNRKRKMALFYEKGVDELKRKINEINNYNNDFLGDIMSYNIEEVQQQINNYEADQDIVLLILEKDQKYYRNLRFNKDVKFFILGNNKNRSLTKQKDTVFVTQDINKEYIRYIYKLNGDPIRIELPIPMPLFNDSKRFLKYNFTGTSLPFPFNMPIKLREIPEKPSETLFQHLQDNHIIPIQLSLQLFDQYKEIIPKNIKLTTDQPLPLLNIQNYVTVKMRPIIAPILIQNQPIENFPESRPDPTLYHSQFMLKKPIPQKKSQNFAIIFPQNHELQSISNCLKKILEEHKKYEVSLMCYRKDADLEEFIERFKSYDKVLVFFDASTYQKYHLRFERLKNSIGSHKLQYFLFDDNFQRHKDSLFNFLQLQRTKYYNLPFIAEISSFMRDAVIINVLVPIREEHKYKAQIQHRGRNLRVRGYGSQKDILNILHNEEQYTLIVCDKQNYPNFKKFVKLSPRVSLVVKAENIKQCQLSLLRYPYYCQYVGNNPVQYLKGIPNIYGSSRILHPYKILFFKDNGDDIKYALDEEYFEYEKIQFRNNHELYHYLLKFNQAKNYLLRVSNSRSYPEQLKIKVYLQDLMYQKQYKNNYLDRGYMHDEYHHSARYIQSIKQHPFKQFPEIFYTSAQDLRYMLEREVTPCVVLIDSAMTSLRAVAYDFKEKHIFFRVTDFNERWIQEDGSLPSNLVDMSLIRKQQMLSQLFNSDIFNKYNEICFRYLTNRKSGKDNFYMPRQQILKRFKQHPNELIVVFLEWGDKNFLPKDQQFIEESQKPNGRVILIYVYEKFKDSSQFLFVKYNQIDPVVRHVSRMEKSGRINYIMYLKPQGQGQFHRIVPKYGYQNYSIIPFKDIEQFDSKANKIKGKYEKVVIIAFKQMFQQIDQILNKYTIRKQNTRDQKAIQKYPIPKHGIEVARPSSILQNIAQESSKYYQQNYEKLENNQLNVYNYPQDKKEVNVIEPNSMENLDRIIKHQEYALYVNQRVKTMLPIGNFYATKVRTFSSQKQLPSRSDGKPQLIITNQQFHSIKSLTKYQQDTFVIYLSNDIKPSQEGNMMVCSQKQVPAIIERLEGNIYSNKDPIPLQDITKYKIIKIIYDNSISQDQQKKIILWSRNQKVIPAVFKTVEQIKNNALNDNNLVMLMLNNQPSNLQRQLQDQGFRLQENKDYKIVVKKNQIPNINGLEVILQESKQYDQQIREILNKKKENQLLEVLSKIQENPDNKNQIFQDFKKEKKQNNQEKRFQPYLEPQSIPNSNIVYEDDYIEKRKPSFPYSRWALFFQASNPKAQQYRQLAKKAQMLSQQITNKQSLANLLKNTKKYNIICIINQKLCDYIIQNKSKFYTMDNVIFILQNYIGVELPLKYRDYIISEHIKSDRELKDLIKKLLNIQGKLLSEQKSYQTSFKRRYPLDDTMEKKFQAMMNNLKNKQIYIFYKNPDNLSIFTKLSQRFNNIKFLSYTNLQQLNRKLSNYMRHPLIIIANGQEAIPIEQMVASKKQAYVIRLNSENVSQNSMDRVVLNANNNQDIQEFFLRNFKNEYKPATVVLREQKRYIQSFAPTIMGTSPRWNNDYVPQFHSYSKLKYVDSKKSSMKKLDSKYYSPKARISERL